MMNIHNEKNFEDIKAKIIKDNVKSTGILMNYQRKTKRGIDLEVKELPKTNYFKPFSKDILKKNLIRFLAKGKAIEIKSTKLEEIHRDKGICFMSYQKDKLMQKKNHNEQLKRILLNKHKQLNNSFSNCNINNKSSSRLSVILMPSSRKINDTRNISLPIVNLNSYCDSNTSNSKPYTNNNTSSYTNANNQRRCGGYREKLFPKQVFEK
jgi:hypothetical protein